MIGSELRAQFKAWLPEETRNDPVPVTITTDVLAGAQYVAIVGSRDFPKPEGPDRIAKLIDLLSPTVTIVTGGAVGVDGWAEEIAREKNRRCAVVRPGKPNRESLMGRNTVIVRGSDAVVAFWNASSNGTRDSIEKALTFHKFVIVALPGLPPEVWCR